MTERQTQYKNQGKDAVTSRKNRAEHALSLRREKRDDVLFKRRNIGQDSDIDETTADANSLPETSMSFDDIVINARSADPVLQLQAVTQARKALSSDRNPPIDELISGGILPILVNCLQSQNPALQFEAAWALTNIASGSSEQTHAVVSSGAVPYFLALLSSSEINVCEQAVWALGNIVGDGPHFRDYCIDLGIIQELVKFIRPDLPLNFLRNVTWVLVNLCRNKPQVSTENVRKLLPALKMLLQHDDPNILTDVAWAYSYLLDSGDEQIELVIQTGVVQTLVELMGNEDPKLQTAALRAVGNIVTGTDAQTQHVLDCGVLKYMLPLLTHYKSKIAKEAAWLTSNITAGSTEQVQAVIAAELIPSIVHLANQGDFSTQKEAAWALTNVTISGNENSVMYLVGCGVIEVFCSLLSISDTQIVQVVLDGLVNILKKSNKDEDEICQKIEECGGLDKIEALQNHESEEIYKLAFDIIDNFFTSEDENAMSHNEKFDFDVVAMPSNGFEF